LKQSRRRSASEASKSLCRHPRACHHLFGVVRKGMKNAAVAAKLALLERSRDVALRQM
jgi:hypothetical protein